MGPAAAVVAKIEVNKRKTTIYDSLNIVGHIATFACIAGMRTPVPEWFQKLPLIIRISWRGFVVLAEASLTIMFLSCAILLATTDNIVFICESMGSIVLLSSTLGKTIVLVMNQTRVNKAIKSLHDVAEELHNNPVDNPHYLAFHNRKLNRVRIYSTARFSMTLLSFLAVNWNRLIPGVIWPRPDTPTPMAGWYPIDRTDRMQFATVCVLIMVYFSLCAVRDMYTDMVLHLILATVNVQIKYLGEVLSDIVQSKTASKRNQLHWWIKTHQKVLKILDELKPFTGPEFFIAHAGNTLLLFFNLIRATEEKNINVTQLATIIGVSAFMLLHLYIVCTIGDDIEKNMKNIGDAVEDKEVWDLQPQNRKYLLIISTFSTKPYAIRFARGVGALRTEPYSSIVINMLGYFNTIYQLRNT